MEEKLSKPLSLTLVVFVTFDTVEAYVAITVHVLTRVCYQQRF